MAGSAAGGVMARRNDVAVKIDADVTRQAKIVAAYKDISLAEYLSEALRAIVRRDLEEHSRKALDPSPDAKTKPKGRDAK